MAVDYSGIVPPMNNVCSASPCMRTSAGCPLCDPRPITQPYQSPVSAFPLPSPRSMPVNVPFSNFGITIITMDRDGNITIKVDQPIPTGER